MWQHAKPEGLQAVTMYIQLYFHYPEKEKEQNGEKKQC